VAQNLQGAVRRPYLHNVCCLAPRLNNRRFSLGFRC
jgi:hypothetical protein